MPSFVVILVLTIISVAGSLLNIFVSHDSIPQIDISSLSIPLPSPTASPNPPSFIKQGQSSLQIDCLGPDGVHFKTTQKACDDLNNFWKNPNQPKPTVVEGGWERWAEGEITHVRIPKDDHMSTPDELFEAMNNYRKAQNLPILTKNDTICHIAQARADELLASGKFNHDGFDKFFEGQTEFRAMSEVLHNAAGNLISGVHIVEYGWDRSLTGHREALQDSKMTYGCGGIAGYFAVFIFGAK